MTRKDGKNVEFRQSYPRLKNPFYALVYAAKGPFVLYKIYNIIFEHGSDPPPLNNVKKTALFLQDGLLETIFIIKITTCL